MYTGRLYFEREKSRALLRYEATTKGGLARDLRARRVIETSPRARTSTRDYRTRAETKQTAMHTRNVGRTREARLFAELEYLRFRRFPRRIHRGINRSFNCDNRSLSPSRALPLSPSVFSQRADAENPYDERIS